MMSHTHKTPGRTEYRLALLGGDGIGPEVVREAQRVLDAVGQRVGIAFAYKEIRCGGKYYQETGKEWPDGAFETCRDWADAIVLGAVGWPGAWLPGGDLAGAGVVFGLRFGLDLYANIRPCKLYRGVRHKIHEEFRQVWEPGKVDMVIVRENTEGCYTPARGALRRGGVSELTVDSRVITRKGSERIIRKAFEVASRRSGAPGDKVRRVTCIDKSNVMAGCQLFREVFDQVAREHPMVQRDYAYVDAFTQWLIREPERYDVCVTTNMLGDIVTDLAAVLQGGMGVAASANVGDRHAMFEGIHGSAPNLAGKDLANPIATVLACGLMLEWLGHRMEDARLHRGAALIERAVESILSHGKVLTQDLGGHAHTTEVGSELARWVGSAQERAV